MYSQKLQLIKETLLTHYEELANIHDNLLINVLIDYNNKNVFAIQLIMY